MYEIIPIIEHLYLKVKDSWEQSRFLAWATLAPHQKNPKPIKDIIEFSWEKEEEQQTDINETSFEDLIEESKKMERILNNE